jgi:hypothetical protein
MKLTKKERQAVEDLEALAERWPKTLGIFSDGTLYVMKLDSKRHFIMRSGTARLDHMDPDYVVARISSIKTDGGDPW